MLKSKKFPVLQAMLCVLAVLCPLALTSCPGNGELDGTDNDTYTPGGGNSNKDKELSALDIINMANGGKWNTLVATLGGQGTSAGGTGSDAENLIDFDPADIGLPSGGTVTLTITGDVEYDETATISDDGKVHFRVPPILTGSTITVKLIVKDSTGAVVFSGDTEQTVSGDSLNIAVNLDPFGVIMKTGPDINEAFSSLGGLEALSFCASPTPPATGTATETLSEPDSPVEVLAWYDEDSIKYYAKGYTDSDVKIPLNEDSSSMFSECRYLESIDLSGFDTSNVTNMANMFSECQSLTSLDLSGFDTSNVTNMASMFYWCCPTSIDLSGFDTSNVTNMEKMFSVCSRVTSLDLSNFDTRNVTNMRSMFSNEPFRLSVKC